MRTIVIGLCLASTLSAAGLPETEIAAAIAYGKTFKTMDKFLQKGMKGVRVKLASGMAMDGISKFATFYNDWNYVAALSAQANQQMREVSPAELKLSGDIHCFVEIHARGSIPTSKMNRRYLNDRAHLVISAAGRVIQPTSKSMLAKSDQSPGMLVIGMDTGKVTLQYVFPADPGLRDKVMVTLIDGDGNKHENDADLSELVRAR